MLPTMTSGGRDRSNTEAREVHLGFLEAERLRLAAERARLRRAALLAFGAGAVALPYAGPAVIIPAVVILLLALAGLDAGTLAHEETCRHLYGAVRDEPPGRTPDYRPAVAPAPEEAVRCAGDPRVVLLYAPLLIATGLAAVFLKGI